MPNPSRELAVLSKPTWRRAWRFVLALAALAAVARLGQLAVAPADAQLNPPPFQGGARGGFHSSATASTRVAIENKPNDFNAELAQFYRQCPTAAVISLADAMAAPEKIDALLPPYRPTADRVPSVPLAPPRVPLALPVSPTPPPAVPRIRYPRPLQPSSTSTTQQGGASVPDAIRTAQLPRIATSIPPSAGNSEPPGDWLIDPHEWYTPEEQARLQETSAAEDSAIDARPPADAPALEPSAEAEDDSAPDGGDSNADVAAPTSEAPTATSTAPTIEVDVSDPDEPSFPTVDATEPAEALPAPQAAPAPPEAELFPPPPAAPRGHPEAPSSAHGATPQQLPNSGVDPHLELFAKNAYPSAHECAACHEEIYEQWSISAHAYAAVSPMFHKFEQKLNDLSQGTVGYFCMRCHAPVATNLHASRAEPLWNLPEVAREGVTCIACHRVQYVYGKSNGERRIEQGDIFAPVMGGIGGDGVAETIHRKAEFKVKTSVAEPGPGQNLHVAGIYFDPLTRSEACTPCHQVAVHPGIKLEVVWEQYRASPACKKGIQCQDCHMGRVPGLPLGYDIGAVAKVAGKTVNDQRKKSNHTFYGPNYSIAHPGVFPFHLKASRWTMEQWLLFDWRAGWGTDEFEDRVADGLLVVHFPPCWVEADDRYDAREIIDDNLKKLNHKREIRQEIMENGSHVEGPFFDSPLCCGEDVKFHYIVTNANQGHNLLTASLGAQPQLWANVVLIGPDGRRLWETGYTDSAGDVANIHSMDVRNGRVPYDRQLFNLQTMFLITGAKGTDREFLVPVNVDIDQLPFLRPGVQPISTINHPPFIRMESQSLAPLGSRRVPYHIPGELIQQPGKYRLSFRLRSRAEPIYLMRFCDATPEMERMMNEWMIDVHPTSVEFYVR